MRECSWPGNNELMKQYHDREWCKPSHDDGYIFEMLNLEGAQAGLSWSTIINKREAYKKAFRNFDVDYCANLTDEELDQIKDGFPIIKNRMKIRAVRNNAVAFQKIQKEFGSFSAFLWSYVDGKPVINRWDSEGQMPAQSPLSEQLSKDMKKRGFQFVGPVIVYSFLQAVGLVDDHIAECPYHTDHR
ncbi:DNA-3-methyladenine glycosylase I [Anoxybacterium hadale]|uniref:DNA-3-methyladenine glycosylase I n=1 Tax=Anoxybacterium hadale TaxID=3408580 RepID=A0ACD1A6I6_9FIRM|nr:DNA-3-methyladenine glycosylase I [Clostridiales bacterium]